MKKLLVLVVLLVLALAYFASGNITRRLIERQVGVMANVSGDSFLTNGEFIGGNSTAIRAPSTLTVKQGTNNQFNDKTLQRAGSTSRNNEPGRQGEVNGTR